MAVRQTALVGKLAISGKEARAELDSVKKKMDDLSRGFSRPIGLRLKVDAPGQNYLKSEAEIVKNRQAAEAATNRLHASNSRLSNGMREMGRSGYTSGQGILELSRAFEDAQYGIRGVLNNIPNVIQMFGGSAGLAGIISAAAVSFTIFGDSVVRAWEALTAAPKWLTERNATAGLRHDRAVAGMRVEARQNSQGAADVAAEVTAAEDRRREREENIIKEKGDLLKEERLYSERLQNNAGQATKARADLAALRKEQREFEMKAATGALSGPENIRNEALPGLISAAESHSSAADARDRSDRESLRATRVKMAKEGAEAVNAVTESLIGVMGEFSDAALAAINRRRRRISTAAESAAGVMDAVVDAINEAEEFAKRARDRNKAQAVTRAAAETDLSVSEIRNPRARRKAAQAVALTRRTQQIMDEQGVDAATAASIAQREQRASNRDAGDRTIKGAPARKYEGLDAFKNFRDGNLPVQTDAQKKGQQALEDAKKTLQNKGIKEKDVPGSKGTVEGLLGQILTAIKEQKGPAERGKPLRSN